MGADRSGRRLALGGAACFALAALCFWPAAVDRLGLLTLTEDGAAQPPRTVVLVDVSASVRRTRAGYAERVREVLDAAGARAAASASGEVAAVAFARDVTTVRAPSRPGADFDASDLAGRMLEGPAAAAAATDLAGAVRLAGEWLGDRGGELVVLSDGTYTGADPRGGLRALSERGTAIRVEAPGPHGSADLALAELALPHSLPAGAPLAAEVLVVGRAAPLEATDARVRLRAVLERLDGSGDPSAERVLEAALEPHVAAATGAGQRLRVPLGSPPKGRFRVRVEAAWLVGGGPLADPVRENDRVEGVVDVGEPLVVAALGPGSGAPADRDAWRAWCADLAERSGLAVHHLEPGRFDARTHPVDLVLSLDVPLVRAEPLGLAAHLAAGGGWLALGEEGLFAGERSALEELSPLLPADVRERRVVFLVDGSGSMVGEPFAEVVSAVLAAIEVAPASDRFELWTFSDRIEARHSLGKGGPGSQAAAAALLEARPPRGATDVLAALEALDGPDLAVLLTDGRQGPGEGGDPPEPAEFARRADAARSKLEAGGGRLVVCGVGATRSEAALAALAGSTPWLRAERGLAGIFRAELGRGRWRVVERPAVVSPRGADGLAPLLEPIAAAYAGLSLPPLEVQRAVIHRAGAGSAAVLVSEPVLVAEDGAPILALRRHGLGALGVLAGVPLGPRAAAWGERPELLAPVLRGLARPGSGRRLRVTEVGTQLVLDGVDPAWPAELRCVFGDGAQRRLSVPPELPGGDARTRRTGPVGPTPPAAGPIVLRGGADGRILAATAWPGSGRGEFSPQPRVWDASPWADRPAGVAGAGHGSGGRQALGAALALGGAGLLLLVASVGISRGRAPFGGSGIAARGR